MKVTYKHIFFYTNWCSNFCQTSFNYTAFNETHHFVTTEQAFMWCKAKTFGDEETALAILNATDPAIAKMLGRKVKNYNDIVWDKVRYGFMVDVNYCKFTQDPVMKKLILEPTFEGKTFVEASSTDPIWGICMRETDPGIDEESNWKGQNLLGQALTRVRELVKLDREK